LTDVFKEQGELFDGDYDAVGIWTGPKKDDRCISEKRNAILTYRDFDDREATTRSWKKIKLAEASARKAVRQNEASRIELPNISIWGLMLKIPRLGDVHYDE
jgi:hypothetical protein